jgi:prepilin-type N-terminal cleavage/methylation domain-containing protein
MGRSWLDGRATAARGFTLIELLVTFAVIAIIATMLIPLFLDAMYKAKQRRTLADIHTLGKALMAWTTDNAAAAAAGQATTSIDMGDYVGPRSLAEIEERLVTQYLQKVPERDGWRYPMEIYLADDVSGSTHLMAVRSPGRSGVYEADVYTVGPFEANLYEQDIVWVDGFFVRWPERQQ